MAYSFCPGTRKRPWPQPKAFTIPGVWAVFPNSSMANTSPIFELAPNQPPEVQIETETEIIYTKPDVDVNWEEEIRLNGTVKANQGANKKGCKGAVTGGAGLTALALVGACLIRRKQR